VASLVLGIVGFFFVFILAIIFGIIALVQIRNSEGRQRGKSQATIGLILSGVWIVVLVIIVALQKPTPTPSSNSNSNASGMPSVGNRSPQRVVADVTTTPLSGSNIWFYPAMRATAVVY
jgi:ABC-type dipeptide/oligopeptide/nickel transport system permease component